MTDLWKPSVTVAAIIERDGYFLLIEENTSEGVRLNQPAGHLDPNESLEAAVIRETMEETAHDFTPTALVGTYLTRVIWRRFGSARDYVFKLRMSDPVKFVITEAEQEKQKQRKDYEMVINERDILGTQLIKRNEELQVLYEKIKIQQSTLDKGEIYY